MSPKFCTIQCMFYLIHDIYTIIMACALLVCWVEIKYTVTDISVMAVSRINKALNALPE